VRLHAGESVATRNRTGGERCADVHRLPARHPAALRAGPQHRGGTIQLYAIDPTTGAAVAFDTPSFVTGIDINSYPGAAGTVIYSLDPVANSLRTFNPSTPENGVLTSVAGITLSGSPLDFSTVAGFDILPERGSHPGNSDPAATYGFAALNVSGAAGLFWINLTNGQATYLGSIGSNLAIGGFAAATTPSTKSRPIRWASTNGGVYIVESSQNLANWASLPGSTTATGTLTYRPVPQYDGEPRRFWREAVK
jgi:hypothetical protein